MNTESDASVQSNSAGWILFEHAGLRVCWGEDPLAEEQDYRGEWNTCLPEDRLIKRKRDRPSEQGSIGDGPQVLLEHQRLRSVDCAFWVAMGRILGLNIGP
jgi:hypothetical protein